MSSFVLLQSWFEAAITLSTGRALALFGPNAIACPFSNAIRGIRKDPQPDIFNS